MDRESIIKASLAHPNPCNEHYTYGTAGFRMLATKLDSVVFAVAILASLRSKKLNGATIGIMITASHNPPPDNGVKIVDPMGEMLQESWERLATTLANTKSGDELIDAILKIVQEQEIDLDIEANVVIGRDSRISGVALTQSVIDALSKFHKTKFQDFDLLTTPQLHYLTRCANDSNFGTPTELGYYKKLSQNFIHCYSIMDKKQPIQITVDAANGIGADKVIKLQPFLLDYVEFKLINSDFVLPTMLNVDCGADFVKTNQTLPARVIAEPQQLYCSFDGDADRIVFYYIDTEKGKFHLLDGDKIATMLASFFESLVKPLKLDLSIGIVQTAYANGNSTNYIEKVLKLPVECTPTGVKHLHHKATEYDVGIYFEANGHGTVLFSQKFINTINSAHDDIAPYLRINLAKLKTMIGLINQTVGDAISDLLTVLLALQELKWDASKWDECYHDLPNKLAKVIVNNRFNFVTTDAERKLVKPEGLQQEIDSIVSGYNNGRSFVRASGTEDAVRVYAEAGTQQECDELSLKVVELVKKNS